MVKEFMLKTKLPIEVFSKTIFNMDKELNTVIFISLGDILSKDKSKEEL